MELNLKSLFFILIFFACSVWAGQNSGAGIRFDMDSTTIGNQNLTTLACPGADILIRVDVYVINASNLDNYELNIYYNSSELTFISGVEDQPVNSEDNFLKKNGGTTVGFTSTVANGVINCANTLHGNQGASTPDGEGLLVSLQFRTLVECPGTLTFGLVEWYDNDAIIDIGIDKGEDVSLPVGLNSFSLAQHGQAILVEWRTSSELNNLGFNILRSDFDTLSYNQINKNLIEGKGNTSTETCYKYLDASVVSGHHYFYKLEQINYDGTRKSFVPKSIYLDPFGQHSNILPDEYSLLQNQPNPFNPSTMIHYQLPMINDAELVIYNQLGQKVVTLVSEKQEAGYYQVEWDASRFPTGVYYYRIKSGEFVDVKKMILLR
jgi:hypothetical protein